MLAGIIKNKTDNIDYYINLKKENNITEISITEVTANSIKDLSKEEFLRLIKTMMSSKLTYKEKYGEYDVYLDESNNKRYLKNGVENLFMFIENNGVSAINYFEKIIKKPSSKFINLITTTIVFELILTSSMLIPFSGDMVIRKKLDISVSSIVKLDSEELINSINNSKHLIEEDKEALINEIYFNFALQHSSSLRNYSLRNRFNDICIKAFSDNDVQYANGYYNVLDPNILYILDTDLECNNYKDILIHEFIHMTQNESKYYYIIESCTEIFKNEFYQQPIIAYHDWVKRTKVLMEIIGPEPIAECNFRGNPKEFETAISEYLSPEETQDFLSLLTIPATEINKPNYDKKTLNDKVDNYLAKMYYNKTGKDIKDDPTIRLIYNDKIGNRIYFNSTLENYNADLYLYTDKKLIGEDSIENIITSNKVDRYEYTETIIKEVDRKIIKYQTKKETNDFSTIPNNSSQNIRIVFKDGTLGSTNYNADKKQWDTVSIYRITQLYEPSIPKKFPKQNTKIKYDSAKDLQIMFENVKRRKSEAKSI